MDRDPGPENLHCNNIVSMYIRLINRKMLMIFSEVSSFIDFFYFIVFFMFFVRTRIFKTTKLGMNLSLTTKIQFDPFLQI